MLQFGAALLGNLLGFAQVPEKNRQEIDQGIKRQIDGISIFVDSLVLTESVLVVITMHT